jgi:hypothetical protein
MAWIWKRHAGSDSFGHVWPENGSVIEIDDPAQIAALKKIPDGGFFEVPPPNTPAAVDETAAEEDAAPATRRRSAKS